VSVPSLLLITAGGVSDWNVISFSMILGGKSLIS
jgi:hypothetical protein